MWDYGDRVCQYSATHSNSSEMTGRKGSPIQWGGWDNPTLGWESEVNNCCSPGVTCFSSSSG
jgi:hypothetical protein